MTMNNEDDIVVVLDTESTGLSFLKGHRLIEVGCVKMINGQITDQTFHEYVDPCRDIPDEATAVHGMTREDVQQLGNRQKFENIADSFLSFIGNHKLVIHNANFDVPFLNFELERSGRQKIKNPVFDTLKYANMKYPGKRNNLDALVKRFGIQTPDRSLHGALLDSQILADVYNVMMRSQDTLAFDAMEKTKVFKELEPRMINAESYNLKEVSVTQEELETHISYFNK